MEETSETHFLNVDLELRSDAALAPLLQALQGFAFALHQEVHWAVLELDTQPATAEEAVLLFADAVASLPASARALWYACRQRRLDIGILAGERPHSRDFVLSPAAVAALSEMAAELAITVYGSATSREKPRVPQTPPSR
ncbi:hypothetical protein FGE12_11030 [Aggregicoccus sp. 17bor-14]|uniref:hypothetical protein n=1 Tax=Myxococcaceae TaxID=31 RepID=UPI00129CB1CF|nr:MULTISPECIES: hypothetical protein [Myxococcaceae]MBF5042922.1 hypothetical protein [Simulacricoccus sp. 17bor-14]MRI88689.1 hypothetical protein [Aggregicoccus sp. 17bor-14]